MKIQNDLSNRITAKLLVFLAFAFFGLNSYAKDTIPKVRSNHAMFFEIGGSAIIYSFNYEYKTVELQKSSIVQSIGFQVPSLGSKQLYSVGGELIEQRRLDLAFFPYRVNWVSHKNSKHHIEAGMGCTYITNSSLVSSIDMTIRKIDLFYRGFFFIPNAGYRYTPSNGLLIRVTVTPFMSRETLPQVQLYGGVSIGYNFKKKVK
jgi:hypothetical protein